MFLRHSVNYSYSFEDIRLEFSVQISKSKEPSIFDLKFDEKNVDAMKKLKTSYCVMAEWFSS